ncbi:MAG: hypothetical protein Q8P18_29900 [Pseudomonadota bacterium]|nr:hypothetical protein [Pseudomonadota bacterium]
MLLTLLLLPLLAGCAPAACEARCADFGQFMTACATPEGTLCEGEVVADCVENVDAYMECAEDGFDPDECGYEERIESGMTHDCRSGPDAAASCTRLTRARFAALETPEERDAYTEECEEGDAFTAAIDAKDCDTVCEMLLGR